MKISNVTRRMALIFTLFAVVGMFCTKEKHIKPGDRILAKVGDRYITVDQFRYSYEFSLANFRQGPNPRRTYLKYMINELLLACEGYRLGLHKHRYVSSRVAHRRRNDLLEAFYTRHVYNKVRIPEDKLQNAIKKGTIKWRMIIWPAATLEDAKRAYVEASKSDLVDFIQHKIEQQELPINDKSYFETDWVDFLDVNPEILDAIKDLEFGKVSQPIPYGPGYAITQILDVHMSGIKSDELEAGVKRKQMYQRLFNIQADSIARAVIDSVMTPLDVRVKGAVVEQLARPLYRWIRDGLPKNQALDAAVREIPDSATIYMQKLKAILDRTLVTSRAGDKTVGDYLSYMNYYRKALKQSESYEDFKQRLITEIGRMLKNEQFERIAMQEGYLDSANIKNDLRVWEEKWTYNIFRHEITKDLSVSDKEIEDFFKHRWRELPIAADVDTTRLYKYEDAVHNAVLHEKFIARMNEKLDELRQKYPVRIDEKLLNEIELTESPKAHQTSLFLTKNFSGEFVMPLLDMKWFSF